MVICPVCGNKKPLSTKLKPAQILLGGWTCPKCKSDIDWFGESKIQRGRINKQGEQVSVNSEKNTAKSSLKILKILGNILLWLLVIYFTFNLLFDTTKEDYNYCIEDCVSEQESCFGWIEITSDIYGEDYLSKLEVESCSLDLGSCTSDCELIYG